MCNILFLPKNIPIKEDAIRNMVENNPDGFGLLFKDTDGTVKQAAREFYPEGTDPNRVIHLLKKYKQHDRLVHVRFNTVGESSLDNTHPFEVFKSNKRVVYMMHNGTMYEYKPTDTKKSDSRFFSEVFLAPLLKEHTKDGNYYKGVLPKIIEKFSSVSSKIVLWGSHLEPLFIGPWIHEKNTEGSYHYSTSNNDYFERVNTTRSVSYRKSGPTNFSSPSAYRNTGARVGSTVWNNTLQKFEETPDRKFLTNDVEVGKSAEAFFPYGRRANTLPKDNGSNLRNRNAAFVDTGRVLPFKLLTPLSEINLQRMDIKKVISDILGTIGSSMDDIDAQSLFTTEGYDMLMHISNAEWAEVVKKHPDAVANLMTLLAYGCSDLESSLLIEQRKTAKQQEIINKTAAALAKYNVKVQDVVA